MAVTCVFILHFIWFYSGLLQRTFELTMLVVDRTIPDAAGIGEFYEVTFMAVLDEFIHQRYVIHRTDK